MRWDFPFVYRVNGIHFATLIASVAISENQWFNYVFYDEYSSRVGVACSQVAGSNQGAGDFRNALSHSRSKTCRRI